MHTAVDTLEHLLVLQVSPADESDRKQVGELTGVIQEVTEESVELAYVDGGYSETLAPYQTSPVLRVNTSRSRALPN